VARKRNQFTLIPGAIAAPMPSGISPTLATLSKVVPAGDSWLHEVKYDGYRILARIDGGKATLFSRSDRVWTAKIQEVADAAAKLKVRSAWVDGEVCAMDKEGRSSSQALQNAASRCFISGAI